MNDSRLFAPTRAAGLTRLGTFAPSAGRRYAAQRNLDLGPDRRGNVSLLSPYIRHRLVTEEEVLAAVLARHTPAAAEKFIQEMFWRTYFKGHLETRPVIWGNYRSALERQAQALGDEGGMGKLYDRAVEGRTGIDGFDAWVLELVETGYLHNHARMWLASIWIFTLRLPWELGADFMLCHLLDGDPASNTLSWRWVGGLHTKGKTYLARRDNIATCTEGRSSPAGLAIEAPPLEEPPLPSAGRLREAADRFPAGKVGLLLTEEDLQPASLARGDAEVVAVAGATLAEGRSPFAVSPLVQRFTDGALMDGLRSAADAFGAPATRLPSLTATAILAWVRASGAATIVTPYAPVGPVATRLAEIAPRLHADGIRLVEVRRAFDTTAWPHGTRGFFAMKEKIPHVLRTLGIGSRGDDAQGALFPA
jgi:deoxyribodipyrimidine photo-lyase